MVLLCSDLFKAHSNCERTEGRPPSSVALHATFRPHGFPFHHLQTFPFYFSLPIRNSGQGYLPPVSPLLITVRLTISITRRCQLFIPSSTRADFFLPTLLCALNSWLSRLSYIFSTHSPNDVVNSVITR